MTIYKHPSTVSASIAAALLGMSQSSVYRAIQEGTFPTPAARVGKGRYVIPTRPLLEFLGLDELPEGVDLEEGQVAA
ncbi:hypothetical protein AY498_09500 [Corynebacterium ulcerans]|uniref:helix-turn-helix transcriptional regulator n=1 Tax=Corynebacterium ulcerans TaxID=65058 RepID=UPI00052A9F97|nr:helix-turn-helix domain-containing protein [Corynebacterium ulcerans]AIU92221.1 Helix-turn-helix domain [Corynebacterium ulcerans]KPH73880.1 hypothetical protein AFK72_11290 [Corynebacterium ulcerans]MBL4943313.1 helix-turn-helix domain-containing protein [Corynebacterium ulcerans]OIS06653.1 hypothetical protein BHG00_03965 [Corynebacterium ulcerans]PME08218.1 hypothetical protein AY498_09500 [Corynebacterium ulcerans]